MAKYKQALLETEDGLFAVSVEASVVLNDFGRIMRPQNVFDEGDTIVAVEQGVMPAGESVEETHPFDIDQTPKIFQSDGPRLGTFMVKYTPDGTITLKLIPSLGQIIR